MSASRRPAIRPSITEWWTEYFDARYLLEYEPLFSLEDDRTQVTRLLELLELPHGARVLDVPCGQGRHAHLLAEAGLQVTGLDYSATLIAKAKGRGVSRTLRYVRGDMRQLPTRWTGMFDAVVNLFTSFGFFADARDDQRVIDGFARMLKPGGTLIWHGGSRDGVMAKFLDRDWWTTTDGTMIGHEREFDPLTGFITVRTTIKGTRTFEREHRIRLYTASQLAEMCRAAGLVVEQAFDGWTEAPLSRESSEMLLLARRD